MNSNISIFLSLCFLMPCAAMYAQQADTVFSERPFFVEYQLDSFVTVRKTRDVKYYREGVEGLLLRETDLSIDTVDGREEYFNQLTVSALEEKTHFTTERWRIRANYEKPKGIYSGEYYVSVMYGCCGTEDEFQLYSLKTGKKVAYANFYSSSVIPYRGLYTYRSPNTVNGNPDFPKGISGELTLFYDADRSAPAKVLKIYISAFNALEYSSFTPDIEVFVKEEFQNKYRLLYPKIEKLNAKYFMMLNYFDEGYIIIPFDNGIPLLSSAVVSHAGVKLSFKK